MQAHTAARLFGACAGITGTCVSSLNPDPLIPFRVWSRQPGWLQLHRNTVAIGVISSIHAPRLLPVMATQILRNINCSTGCPHISWSSPVLLVSKQPVPRSRSRRTHDLSLPIGCSHTDCTYHVQWSVDAPNADCLPRKVSGPTLRELWGATHSYTPWSHLSEHRRRPCELCAAV